MVQYTTVDILRHGETQGVNCYRGITDDPLSQKGWQQMRNAVTGDQCWDIIISSPLCRCADFARELSQQRQTPVHFEDAFKEFNFGVWEGKTADQINRLDPNALMNFYTDPIHYPPPQSENMHDFRQRVIAGWQQLINELQGQLVLLICHAGVIRMLFAHLLEIPLQRTFQIQVEQAGITRFRYIPPDFYQLVCHGC